MLSGDTFSESYRVSHQSADIVADYPRRPRSTLTLDQFSRVLSDEGFEIVESTYYGYLPRPGRLFPHLCEALIEPFEKACRRLRVPGWFAESFIVVARKP